MLCDARLRELASEKHIVLRMTKTRVGKRQTERERPVMLILLADRENNDLFVIRLRCYYEQKYIQCAIILYFNQLYCTKINI